MKAKVKRADFNCTAAGRYALALEQALSEAFSHGQWEKPISLKHLELVGGCMLYRVPSNYWRRD